MDATAVATLAIAVLGVALGLFSARSDRTKTLVESVDQALGWKKERIDALEAEVDGLHNEVERLVRCLQAHGLNPNDCSST